MLVAVDDVDAGAEAVAEVLAEAGSLGRRPVLVVLALDDEHATDEDAPCRARARGLRARRGADARWTRSRCAGSRRSIWLEDSLAELPAGLLESTGGVPRRLHQTVASWAEDRATRRLGVLASQAAG